MPAAPTTQLASPFGIPGFVISGLNLTVAYTWAPAARRRHLPPVSSYTLSGQVLLGPVPAASQPDQRPSVAATLALLSGKPVLFDVAGSTPPAAGQPYTGGPLLAFQTGSQSTFKLSAGVNFLGSAFLAVDVGVSKGSDGGTVTAGHLTAAQSLTPFGILSCDFSYATHPGGDGTFAIDNWPEFTLAGVVVDIVNAIKALANISADSSCGTLADFVANNAFTGSFTVTPSVSLKRDASGTNLAFALTGAYSLTITLPGASGPFVRPPATARLHRADPGHDQRGRTCPARSRPGWRTRPPCSLTICWAIGRRSPCSSPWWSVRRPPRWPRAGL